MPRLELPEPYRSHFLRISWPETNLSGQLIVEPVTIGCPLLWKKMPG
jgi:hypothetical protein